MKAKFTKPQHISKSNLIIYALIFAVIAGILLIRSFALNPNLPGDVNNDNVVNITDLSILLSNYGTNHAPADFNSDGTVNILDLSILLTNYNRTYTPPPPPPPSGVNFGVAMPCDLICYENAANKDAEFADVAATGAKWVRIDLRWSAIENTGPTATNWAAFDDTLNRALAHGLQVLPILHSTPGWANGGKSPEYMPNNINDWSNFVTKAVNHQKTKIKYWEIWNEPNYSAFFAGSVADYTNLLVSAYTAIKTADPTAKVLSGGLVPAGGTLSDPMSMPSYVTAIYNNGGGGYFDIMATHPYPGDGDSSGTNAWNGWYQTLKVRDIMVARGDGSKPIWGTEYGYNLTGYLPAPNEATIQSRMTTDIAHWKNYPWAGTLFWYTDRDDNITGDYGLSNNTYPLVHRPRWTTWQNSIR